MERPINERYALAVRYKTNDPDFDGLVQRENQKLIVAGNDSLLLKLIKPRNARPGFPTWNLEWKNVYRIASDMIRCMMQFDIHEFGQHIPGIQDKEVSGRSSDPQGRP